MSSGSETRPPSPPTSQEPGIQRPDDVETVALKKDQATQTDALRLLDVQELSDLLDKDADLYISRNQSTTDTQSIRDYNSQLIDACKAQFGAGAEPSPVGGPKRLQKLKGCNLVGLPNFDKKSCYFNSVTQMLHLIEEFTNYVQTNAQSKLYEVFPKLLEMMGRVGKTPIDRTIVFDAYTANGVACKFDLSRQQDAVENFELLMADGAKYLPPPSEVVELDQKCQSCHKNLPNVMMSPRASSLHLVPKYREDSLQELIEDFQSVACDCGVISQKEFTHPSVLVLKVERVVEHSSKTNFKLQLPSKVFMFGKEEYKIIGILMHEGKTNKLGHYWVSVKMTNGKWFEINDLIKGFISWESLCHQAEEKCTMIFARKALKDDVMCSPDTKRIRIMAVDSEEGGS